MDPAGPIDRELGDALDGLARKARKKCRRAAEVGSVEAIHAARTSLARVLATLAVIDALRVAPHRRTRRTIDEVQALARACGDARDDDVMLGVIEQAAPAARGDGLRELVARVRRHRRRALARLREAVSRRGKRTFQRTRELARSGVGAPPLVGGMRGALPVLVRHRMAEALAHAFSLLLAYDVQVEEGANDDVIHKVRSSARTLRYEIELFDGALPSSSGRLAAELHALQTRLGVLHDRALALARTRRWLRARKIPLRADVAALAFVLEEEGERQRAGFEREWRALQGGFQSRLVEVGRYSREGDGGG